MFDLTNTIIKCSYGYYTEALLYKQLDLAKLLQTFPRIQDVSHIIMYTNKSRRKSYRYYYKRESQTPKIYDLHIFIVQSKTNTLFLLSANHEKIDGCYLYEIMYLWSSRYFQCARDIPISRNVVKTIGNSHFLPLRNSFINKIKTKHNVSAYIACVSVWSLYFKNKFHDASFGQVIGIRKPNDGIGNYIFCDYYTITDEFASTCEIIKGNIERAKRTERTQFTYITSHVNCLLNIGKNGIWFDSHTMFQHTMFPSFQSAYIDSDADLTSTYIIPNLLLIGIQNDSYVLYKALPKLPVWQTDMSDFRKFCRQIN